VARDGHILWIQDEATLVGGSNGAPLCWEGAMTIVAPPEPSD
jgi:hypothetical protein